VGRSRSVCLRKRPRREREDSANGGEKFFAQEGIADQGVERGDVADPRVVADGFGFPIQHFDDGAQVER
jgi:hypothetical protein